MEIEQGCGWKGTHTAIAREGLGELDFVWDLSK